MQKLLGLIKANWQAGLTVSLVSIPLSISLAVASHTSPITGIITAIWAGLFASIFGGSNFNIVGPTGALSGMLAAYAINHGADSLSSLAIASGVLILVAFALKLEKYLIFIPSSVIHGFTLGVAFIIAFGQMNYALGLKGLTSHSKFFENLIESFLHINQTSLITFAVFAIFLAGLFIIRRLITQVPSSVILAPVGILLGYLSTAKYIPLTIETLESKFGAIPLTLINTPHFTFNMTLLAGAATVAVIAILETMLSAKIADGMTHTKHNGRKEMFGLGIANIASGLAGGIPATAALARTSLNIKSGATHKTSATISSISIAVISIFLIGFFKYIPMSVIAAILTFVAINMVEMEHFHRYFHFDRAGFFIALAVAGITIYEDPIVGMLFGTTISLLLFVEKLSHGQFDIVLNKFDKGVVGTISGEDFANKDKNADILLYSIRGKLCYINSRAHVSRFETRLKKYKNVILRLREVYFMDLDGVEAINEIIEITHSKHQTVAITGANAEVAGLLKQLSPAYNELKEQGLVFSKSQEALKYFKHQSKL